jgi:uncharacterized repeat protein (TIGR01451 family)
VHITSPTTGDTCGTVSNSVSATSGNDGSPSVGPVPITVHCPSIGISKTADAASVKGGDQIGFVITVSNSGGGSAFGVKLSDPLPAGQGLDWTIASQSAGWAGTCAISSGVLSCGGSAGVTLAPGGGFSVHIISPTTASECGSTIDNTATVSLTNGTGGSDGDSIAVTCSVLSVQLTKDGPSAAHVGDTIHYTLTVTNGSDQSLFNVTVTDPVCDSAPVYGSGDTNNDQVLQTSETWVFTCDHVVSSSDPDPLPNTATVDATDKLGRPTSADASHSVDIIHPAISIAKTASPASGAPGDTVTYTYVVTNTGDTTLFNVTVVDDKLGDITNGTPIASLAPGQSVTLKKTTKLPNAAGALTNVGTAAGTDVLGKNVSARDSATVTVVLAVLVKTGVDSRTAGLVGFLFIALGVVMVTRKERGRVRPAFAPSNGPASRAVMLAAHRRSWRIRRRRGPPTRARPPWRRSQGPPDEGRILEI